MADTDDNIRLVKLCKQSGMFQANTLKAMFGNAMAYLYNDENLFGIGIFFLIRGLSGKAQNTNMDALDYVFKNKSEIEKKQAYLPAVMLTFVYKNESRLYYSIYSILAAIGDILRAKELGNDVMTTFNEVSLLRSFQVSDRITKLEKNEEEDPHIPTDELSEDMTDTFSHELETWVESIMDIFKAPYVIGKISTRFYYSQRNIYQSLKDEKDEKDSRANVRKVELGKIISLSVLDFLNATLIDCVMIMRVL